MHVKLLQKHRINNLKEYFLTDNDNNNSSTSRLISPDYKSIKLLHALYPSINIVFCDTRTLNSTFWYSYPWAVWGPRITHNFLSFAPWTRGYVQLVDKRQPWLYHKVASSNQIANKFAYWLSPLNITLKHR